MIEKHVFSGIITLFKFMYVCIYKYIYTYVHIYIYLGIHTYTYAHFMATAEEVVFKGVFSNYDFRAGGILALKCRGLRRLICLA